MDPGSGQSIRPRPRCIFLVQLLNLLLYLAPKFQRMCDFVKWPRVFALSLI